MNSLDEDNRRFNPDEVFETVEDARETVEFFMSVYEHGEGSLVYPMIDPHYPKVHCWKTSLHSFEHALFGYMSAAQLTDSEFDLYYAFAEDEAIAEDEVEVYMFSANGKELSKGDKIAGTEKQCVYKVKFNQLY